MRTSDDWSSKETLDRAEAHLKRLATFMEEHGHKAEMMVLRHEDGSGEIRCYPHLKVGKRLACALELRKKTGPFAVEMLGRVSLVMDVSQGKTKRFTESKTGLKLKWGVIEDWALQIIEARKADQDLANAIRDARAAANKRIDVFFPEGRSFRDAFPGTRHAGMSASIDKETLKPLFRIQVTVDDEAFEPVMEAMQVALAPYAKPEDES